MKKSEWQRPRRFAFLKKGFLVKSLTMTTMPVNIKKTVMSQATTLIRHQKTFRKFKHPQIWTKDCIQKKSLKHVQKQLFYTLSQKSVAT